MCICIGRLLYVLLPRERPGGASKEQRSGRWHAGDMPAAEGIAADGGHDASIEYYACFYTCCDARREHAQGPADAGTRGCGSWPAADADYRPLVAMQRALPLMAVQL